MGWDTGAKTESVPFHDVTNSKNTLHNKISVINECSDSSEGDGIKSKKREDSDGAETKKKTALRLQKKPSEREKVILRNKAVVNLLKTIGEANDFEKDKRKSLKKWTEESLENNVSFDYAGDKSFSMSFKKPKWSHPYAFSPPHYTQTLKFVVLGSIIPFFFFFFGFLFCFFLFFFFCALLSLYSQRLLFITPPPLSQKFKNIVVQKKKKENSADFNLHISNILKAKDLYDSRKGEIISVNSSSVPFSSLSIISPISFVITTQYPFIINNDLFRSNSAATSPVILKNGIYLFTYFIYYYYYYYYFLNMKGRRLFLLKI
jgi:hypothetical protein